MAAFRLVQDISFPCPCPCLQGQDMKMVTIKGCRRTYVSDTVHLNCNSIPEGFAKFFSVCVGSTDVSWCGEMPLVSVKV